MKELEVNPDKSLQGGLQAARRAVRLLNQLGRSTQVIAQQKSHLLLLFNKHILVLRFIPKTLQQHVENTV